MTDNDTARLRSIEDLYDKALAELATALALPGKENADAHRKHFEAFVFYSQAARVEALVALEMEQSPELEEATIRQHAETIMEERVAKISQDCGRPHQSGRS